jgi:hypothetical protein
LVDKIIKKWYFIILMSIEANQQSVLEHGTFTFGNNDHYEANRLRIQDGEPRLDMLDVEKITIERDDYLASLDDINECWQVLEDRRSGKTFEIAVIHDDEDPSDNADVELATFSSNLLGNPGNAVEFAENAAAHPGIRRIYIATPGNGKTSYWEPAERRYTKNTGKFITEDGEPLPTIASLARCLLAAGYAVNRFSANSAGGAYATALMHALPEGQVSHAYIKSRPNLVDHPRRLLWGAAVVLGDMLDDRQFQKASRDDWRLTGEMIAEAKLRLPRLYDKTVLNPARDLAMNGPGNHGLQKMWEDMVAFSRGARGRGASPAAIDTARALEKQPEALLTYHMPDKDRLYGNHHEVGLDFIQAVQRVGHTAAGVEVLLMPGAHRDHTQYPSLRWSFESYAFDRQPH